jgi:transcriptional regulator with XRE-family HTH domain
MADGVDVVDVPPVPDVVEAVRAVSGAPATIRARLKRRWACTSGSCCQPGLVGRRLASSAGLSTGMLSKIENGQISASLTSIHSLAQALSVPMSSLFALAEGGTTARSWLPGKASRSSGAAPSRPCLPVARPSPEREMAIEPYLITLSDGAVPYTSFAHAGTELIHMLEGTLSYRHGNRLYKLSPGDTLLFDSQAGMALRNWARGRCAISRSSSIRAAAAADRRRA